MHRFLSRFNLKTGVTDNIFKQLLLYAFNVKNATKYINNMQFYNIKVILRELYILTVRRSGTSFRIRLRGLRKFLRRIFTDMPGPISV